MIIDRLTAVLTADTGGFEGGMNRAQAQLAGFTRSSENAGHGVTMLRRGFQGLAIQATGVGGPIGHITSGLLMLGAGSAVMLGAAAGIGLVAAAFKYLEERAIAAGKADLEATAIIARHGQLLLGISASPENRSLLAGNVTAAQQAVQQAQDRYVDSIGHGTEATQLFWDALIRAKVGLMQAEQALARMDVTLGRVAASLNQVRKGMEGIKSFQEANMKGGGFENIKGMAEPIAAFGGMEGIKSFQEAHIKGGGVENLKGMIEPITDATTEAMLAAGMAGGQAFVNGLMQGIVSLKDVLRAFLEVFFEIGVLKVVKDVLKVHSPSQVAFGMGQNFSMGLAQGIAAGGMNVAGASASLTARLVGSASLGLNVSGMPQAGNPLAAARDADWQRFLRESNLVAQSGGFRFA